MERFRKQIDEFDMELIAILKKRMAVSKEIGKYKKECGLPVYDPVREKAVIDKLKILADDYLTSESIEKIYTEIFSASKSLQK